MRIAIYGAGAYGKAFFDALAKAEVDVCLGFEIVLYCIPKDIKDDR